MKISPINPVVHKSIKNFLTKDSIGLETFYDYDNVEYVIQKDEEDPDTLKFGFTCNCFEQIM